MHKRHGTRRWLLGSLVVLVAALAVLGSGQGASAEGKSPRPHLGYDSKEDMKLLCKIYDGTFSENGDGSISCTIPGYGTVTCTADGQSCWLYPARFQPSGGGTSYDGSVDQVETGGGTGYPGTRGQQLEDRQDAQASVAADDDQEPKAKPNGKKGKHGKKHGRGGKGRK